MWGMKKLLGNPLFYTSLVLALLLGFQVYGFVSAAVNTYVPPPGPPTQGNPAQPLDTSSAIQYKSGELNIGTLNIGTETGPRLSITPTVPKITFKDGLNVGSIYLNNVDGGTLMVNSGGKSFPIGTGTGGGGSLWALTDPAVSTVSGPNIFYKGGAVFVGEYPKIAASAEKLAYFPRYSGTAVNTTQEGINFGSYNFAWDTDSSAVNALGTNDRLGCDNSNVNIKDCFGSASLESGSASTPSVRYNVSRAIGQGAFSFSGSYAQKYDKVDASTYYYKISTAGQGNTGQRPRLWCDTSDGSKEAKDAADLNGGNLQLGVYGMDCPETLPAPPPGLAGGWPNTVYDYITSLVDYGYVDLQRGYIPDIRVISDIRVYTRYRVETPPVSSNFIRLNTNGSAEFAGGKFSISLDGNVYLERGRGISLTQGWITMTGSISATNLYLGGETKVNGKRVYQIVGGCNISGSECLFGTSFGVIDSNGDCSSGAERIGGKTVGFAFCAY